MNTKRKVRKSLRTFVLTDADAAIAALASDAIIRSSSLCNFRLELSGFHCIANKSTKSSEELHIDRIESFRQLL